MGRTRWSARRGTAARDHRPTPRPHPAAGADRRREARPGRRAGGGWRPGAASTEPYLMRRPDSSMTGSANCTDRSDIDERRFLRDPLADADAVVDAPQRRRCVPAVLAEYPHEGWDEHAP